MQAYEQLVYANVIFAKDPVTERFVSENHTGPYSDAAQYLSKPFAPLRRLDLYPRVGVKFGRYAVGRSWRTFTESTKDFNGTRRNGKYPGAYEGQGRNPGRLPDLRPGIHAVSEQAMITTH